MIKIDEKYYIDSDSYQYILQEKKINQNNNKEYYSIIAYLSSIEKCIETVMKIKERELCQKDLTLEESLVEMKNIKNEMTEKLKVIVDLEMI